MFLQNKTVKGVGVNERYGDYGRAHDKNYLSHLLEKLIVDNFIPQIIRD